MGRILVTGDKHGCYDELIAFLDVIEADASDVVIVLGDHGTLYYGPPGDNRKKKMLSKRPVTFIMIRGNHDRRPDASIYQHEIQHLTSPEYEGDFFVDPKYPNILYTKEFGWYRFGSKRTFVIGGAYSVDKDRRLHMQRLGFTTYHWFADEQLDEVERLRAEHELLPCAQGQYYIMSHTCPLKFKPLDKLLPGVNQATVDDTMEKWLDAVDNNINCTKWYCGHWHLDREVKHMRFVYDDVKLFDEIEVTQLESEDKKSA